ncbi:hypothetical protein [Sphingomonas jatrophae]|uniref:Uncharacterized protein n=1 Tax=Sphingomonas jatrophae TaxID=1166337 RepID=A0A1I6K6H5_9SPHN|nr:hypothetical protein [Sphingomonas jatrophae]SFR86450.1 hypothetical protein SAMN05192580_1347 [Sphingomonas jatrophae]
MTLARPIATSFNGGELSPRMGGRVDTAIYPVGVETCENFVPTVEGAAVKRPGFEYIRPSRVTAGWLAAFRFNLTQQYLLEFSDGIVRFFTNGERIETSPNVPLELAVPYSAAEAPFISMQQSFDRLYLAHPDHPPAAIVRTGATSFTYEVLELLNGPFADPNGDEAATVAVSDTTGTVTVTATKPIFAAGDVGASIRIEARDFSDVTAWDAGMDGVTVGQRRRSEGKVYVAETPGRTGTIQPIHTSGSEWDGSNQGEDINEKGPFGVRWRYLHDRFGQGRITAVASDGMSATVEVTRRLADSVKTVATHRWAKSIFSAAAGWPSVVKVAFGRLLFFKGFDVVGSVAGDYGGGRVNFATTTSAGLIAADLGFRRTLATEDPVLWVAGDRKLIVGTASKELAVGAINSGAAVSGDNIAADPQSFYGSERVWPAQIGTSTIFVQRGGRKLREAQYAFANDRYVAANMTVWCRHVTRSGIRQFAFQAEPEELLLAVRADGQIAVHPHAPEQEIKGFARIVPGGGGRILSAVTIVGADGLTDELWCLIEREGVRSVEKMAPWRDEGDPLENAFFVDAGVSGIAASGQTHFAGLAHLAGKPVAVLAAGGVVQNITVNPDGSIDLPENAVPDERPFRITIGLRYDATLTTLRPELRTNGETSQGKRQRLVGIVLRLLDTVGIRVGAKGGKLDELIDRTGSDRMDEPVPPLSADSERSVSGGWDRHGQATFVSSDPLPAVIVAAMPKVAVGS